MENSSEKFYEKAKKFNSEEEKKVRNTTQAISMNTIKDLYRNDPKENFVKILRGNKKLEPRVKDNKGTSAINGRVSGVSFSSYVHAKTGKLPNLKNSSFGDARILVPMRILADEMKEGFNLYVSEFAMDRWGKLGYLTLIMAEIEGEADMFCKEHALFPLPKDNPFFMIQNGNEDMEVTVSAFTRVNILYTKEVDLSMYQNRGIHFEPPINVVDKSSDIIGGGIGSPYTEPILIGLVYGIMIIMISIMIFAIAAIGFLTRSTRQITKQFSTYSVPLQHVIRYY